jgi:methionyl-tRNA formyltransferase
MHTPLRFVYFGGEPLGVPVLEELKMANLLPCLIVCNPDRPAGRNLELTPPHVKVWAQAHNIPVFQPTSLTNKEELTPLTEGDFDLFVVVAYNRIMPEWLIELPKHKTINLHPSLLPQYRGASPIRTAILEDNRDAVGVSVMLMDKEMDHGPLLAQERFTLTAAQWPIDGLILDAALSEAGGKLLAETIPPFIAGTITPEEQAHQKATYCGKISRADGELFINPWRLPEGETAYRALLKIRAFAGWPGTFFVHENKRVKIIDASLGDTGALTIHTVVPEGKKVQAFTQYLASLHA